MRCTSRSKSAASAGAGSTISGKRSIEEAVRDTDGAYLVYDGEPITACFHASSAGYTESGAAVWGGDVRIS